MPGWACCRGSDVVLRMKEMFLFTDRRVTSGPLSCSLHCGSHCLPTQQRFASLHSLSMLTQTSHADSLHSLPHRLITIHQYLFVLKMQFMAISSIDVITGNTPKVGFSRRCLLFDFAFFRWFLGRFSAHLSPEVIIYSLR